MIKLFFIDIFGNLNNDTTFYPYCHSKNSMPVLF